MPNTLNGGYNWIRNCLACDSTNLYMIMDFGRTPLPNAFTTLPNYGAPDYPLELMHCKDCKHFQLGGAPAPEDMFTDYLYVNSASTLKQHHEYLVQDCEMEGLLKRSYMDHQRVLDVGGNSGDLANTFREHGWNSYVIDPAENLQGLRFLNSVPSYTGMFSSKLVQELGLKSKFRLITALNVVPHTPNPYDMLLGMKECLAPGGHILIELVYFKSTWETRDFGQIYFEHFSYFTVESFRVLAERAGLRIQSAKFFPDIHGGTMRFVLNSDGPTLFDHHYPYEMKLAEITSGIQDVDHLKHWRFAVESNIVTLANKVKEYHRQGRTVVAYGASAKSSTLFNHKLFKDVAQHIRYVVDDNPLKVHRYTPGTHIPIVPTRTLAEDNYPVILITPHNFRKEITEKIKGLTNKATLLHYVPAIEVEEIC